MQSEQTLLMTLVGPYTGYPSSEWRAK